MNPDSDACPREGVPADYPGRIVDIPSTVTQLVCGIFGVQSRDPAAAADFVRELSAHCQRPGGPEHLERMDYTDAAGYASTVLLAYWTSREAHAGWWTAPETARWWSRLDREAHTETGWWREVMTPRAARFQFAAGTDDRAGSAAIMPLRPCATFGYWGAYRDRLPASAYDDFASPLAQVPPPADRDTRGRRLRARVPDNLCYIREGQGWGNCAAEEKRVWDEDMAPVVDDWVAALARDPVATGCLSIRHCTERELGGGALPRQSQLAFLLSLGHIEQAARTHPAHLAVHARFIRMYTAPRYTPRMHVWVEVAILKQDELDTEYVNCHPRTGLLPFFPLEELRP
jgi:aldoxime dehydratase